MMKREFDEAAVPILVTARAAGPDGAALSDAIKLMPWRGHGVWSEVGSFPGHTGDSRIGQALLHLAKANYIKVSFGTHKNVEESFWNLIGEVKGPNRGSLEQGSHVARLLSGLEQHIRIKLSDSFFSAQDILGFSLTEMSNRSQNSVIVSPKFDAPRERSFDIFVIMPFAADFRDVYDHAISPAAFDCRKRIGRGDDFFGANYVIDDIWSSIYHADSIVADCTGRNANVFYELGIAHTLGKDVFLMTQHEVDIPFDLRHWRYHVYENTGDGRQKLRHSLARFFEGGSRKDFDFGAWRAQQLAKPKPRT